MPHVCPICRSKNCHVCFDLSDDRHGYPGIFPLVRCDSCGHRFLMAEFDQARIVDLYTRYYPRRSFKFEDYRPSAEVRGIAAWFNGAARAAYSWVPRDVRVLDIGCGFGETLDYHQGRGCEAHGVEADGNALCVAERFGLNIKAGVFDPTAYETDYFDYVTLDQVLEHMTAPCAALFNIKRVLKPGGRVIISAPNHEGWGARLFRRRWINWHAPYHLHHFSRRSLHLAAGQAGLVLERTETITASEWLHYQWAHLATYPESGVPSVYWTPTAEQTRAVRIVLKGLLLLRRTGFNHLITRIFDLCGIGDNRLYFLRKP
jgi:SAM-dependent methyltransferase